MSKDVTFLIGNGFDLNVGLNTRYTDFYKIYTAENANDSDIIRRFKKDILKSEEENWKTWADFEMGMGQQSKNFAGNNQVEDFIECFNDFVVCFNKYLVDECEKISWNAVEKSIYELFVNSVVHFYIYIKSVGTKYMQETIEHLQDQGAKTHFIQFNYTNAFDKLIQRSNLVKLVSAYHFTFGENLHVHGKIYGGHPSIGVNDESQIENETIRNDPRIQTIFIKPKFLDALQNRNINQIIPRTEALNAITESAVICSFGASMGDSDKYWWEKIGEWLRQSDGLLVIFDISGSRDDGTSPLAFLNSINDVENRKKEIFQRFIRLSGIDSNWLNDNPNKILVELDSDMFSFKLSKREIPKEKVAVHL